MVTLSACAVRSPIVSVRSFCTRSAVALDRPWSQYCLYSRRTVEVQSQYMCDLRIDRAQTEYGSSATTATAGRSYCDHSTSCASAYRLQIDCTPIEKSQSGILNIPKFRTATKIATATVR